MGREGIRTSCENRGIDAIYHYSVLDNLPSIIMNRGILSRAERKGCGILCSEHTWGPTGRAEELREYISCSLEPPYGMIESEIGSGRLILCELAASLIWREGTLFCPAWSSYRKFNLEYLKTHCGEEDFDCMFPNPFSSEPIFHGAEILVKDLIPLYNIRRVYFIDANALNWAVKECTAVVEQQGRIGVTIYFAVRPEVFKRPSDHYLKRKRFANRG